MSWMNVFDALVLSAVIVCVAVAGCALTDPESIPCEITADQKAAVVRIGNCSGVCLDPSGLVATAKHCTLGDEVEILWHNRVTRARKVWEGPYADGVVIYRCQASRTPYPALAVAAQPPQTGTNVLTYGWPGGEHSRHFAESRGSLLKYELSTRADGVVQVNRTTCTIAPGWSGGPLVTPAGTVCGLAVQECSDRTSLFCGWNAVVEALAAARKVSEPQPTPALPVPASTEPRLGPAPSAKPELLIFTATWCSPCQQFKKDLSGPLSWVPEAFTLRWIDVDQEPAMVRANEVTRVPTFISNGKRIVGYQQGDWINPGAPKPALQPGALSPAEQQPNAPSLPPTPQPGPSGPAVQAPTQNRNWTGRAVGWAIGLGKWALPLLAPEISVPALTAIGIASAGWGLWSRLRGRVATEQIPLVKDFPNLHRDYSAVFAEHMESAGLNRVAVAAELNAFVKAYELLQGGNLPVPGAKSSELVDLAVKVRRWVNASFRDQHLHAANSNNVNHQAFTAYLYRRATQLLKEGEFGMTRFAESAAEAIQDHVDVMFQTQLVTQE